MGSSPRTKLLTADVVSYQKGYHPFSALNKVRALAATGGDIYGVNKQDHYTGAQRFRIIADGDATEWTEDDFPALADADQQLAAALTNANRMRIVAVVNDTNVLARTGSDVAADDGNMRVYDDGGTATLEAQKAGGGAYGAGTIIDVYLCDAADIVTQTIVTGQPKEIDCYDFMVPDEATVIEQL